MLFFKSPIRRYRIEIFGVVFRKTIVTRNIDPTIAQYLKEDMNAHSPLFDYPKTRNNSCVIIQGFCLDLNS
jgi:hypothetical protein